VKLKEIADPCLASARSGMRSDANETATKNENEYIELHCNFHL